MVLSAKPLFSKQNNSLLRFIISQKKKLRKMEPRDESFILNYQKGQDCPQGAAALEAALFITLHSILLSRLGYLKLV